MSALQLWLQNHNRKLTQDAIDEALMEYIAHVENQRDELLAALRGLVASCDTGERGPDGRQHGTRMPDRCFVQAGHDAIARVKGSAA